MAKRILARFPAGAPRGAWPAEEFAAHRRDEGTPATVVMDLAADAFLVVAPAAEAAPPATVAAGVRGAAGRPRKAARPL